MTTTTSPAPSPPHRSARAAANDCFTTYPPQWMPAILRARAAEFAAVPRIAFVRAGDSGPTKTLPHPLALRIPPVAVTLLVGLGAWLSAHAFPELRLESVSLLGIAAALGIFGGGCALLGVVSFRRARTTVNPAKPGAATALVVSGVYRFTRNPMYLGFLVLVLGELAWLGSPIALIAAPAFVIYLNRFQIAPEESALRERFGAEFNAYTTRVPRWL